MCDNVPTNLNWWRLPLVPYLGRLIHVTGILPSRFEAAPIAVRQSCSLRKRLGGLGGSQVLLIGYLIVRELQGTWLDDKNEEVC